MLSSTYRALLFAIFLVSFDLMAQTNSSGTITGVITDESTGRPIEFVNVTLHNGADSSLITGKVTDNQGKFAFIDLPDGEYLIRYKIIGYEEIMSPSYKLYLQHQKLNVGTISLNTKTVDLEEVLVTADKSMFNNSIDRKVYNVEQDLMSKSGSASELLQNVPSVQVDVDGNVSLRGSSNVLIMLNGKTSPMMQKNSAEVLQQMPASSIEKIEIITNPSAKYKPDGTSGIINIVLKKTTMPGINGGFTGNIGNQHRLNGNFKINYNPGKLNLHGSYSIRKDNRNRINSDARTQIDTASILSHYRNDLYSYASPLSHMVELGLDYHLGESDQLGLSGNYFHNSFTRTENSKKVLQNAEMLVTNRYNRDRLDFEYEKEYSLTAYFEHDFQKKDHTLRFELNASQSPEQEDNRYSNVFLLPVPDTTYDNTLIKNSDDRAEITVDYSDPISDESSLEAGYAGNFSRYDLNLYADYYDLNRRSLINDTTKTNRFRYNETVHALYGTYKQSFGNFGIQGGVRTEQSYIKSNQVTRYSIIYNDYLKIFPTLHLSYKLNETAELQLSYSKRTRRPEGEDLNPFPEYRDPKNIQMGNPELLPEYIHSLELGYQIQTDHISFLPSVYYRYTYNRFTSVTTIKNDSILLTTRENLLNDQSGGLEVIVSANLGDLFIAHASASGFHNTIDASNLGFSQKRSTNSWSGTITLNFNLTNASRMQINSNYNSSRLTPQGENRPSYVVNAGFRQDLFEGKFSMVLTVADIFKTLKRQVELNTPFINQTVISTRDSRIIYFGFTYHLGSPQKKMKEEQLKYDDNI